LNRTRVAGLGAGKALLRTKVVQGPGGLKVSARSAASPSSVQRLRLQSPGLWEGSMLLWERANRGRWRATQLLNHIPGAFRAPVDVEAIAATLGIDVVGDEMPEDGLIEYDGVNAPTVRLGNASASVKRRRFTLAHELGHAVLHLKIGEACAMPRDTFGEGTSPPLEAQANAFAANLLVPFELLDIIGPRVVWNIDALVDAFGVSKSMIYIRMSQRSGPGPRYGR
jgi:hypothetical protein